MPKLIGIDYGSKRVGVSVSDESGSVAFPKAVLPNDHNLLQHVAQLVKAEQAARVVIGESKKPSGEDNAIMASARDFSASLSEETGVEVAFEPEFYTSVEARRDAEHAHVDAQAAAIILNSYITRTKRS